MNGIPIPVRPVFRANWCSATLTITDSEVSDVEDGEALDESLFDRIAALKDIVPPVYRKNLSSATSTGYSWASKALSLGGKTLWVVSTSALLLGVPWALAFGEEQQVQEMEREMQMQRNANEVSVLHISGVTIWTDGLLTRYV
jgi:import receptor subunit TOM22